MFRVVGVFRVFRVFRMFRVFRVFRVLKLCRPRRRAEDLRSGCCTWVVF